ncbi:uncharacterized protein LOC114934365 isoform X2 [Nylanderia fulva]|uniref:uncharacterized protein LOC114934365 isoform X2 n=1 Tax=Nylanderia fulva TaxID=613905 RepID=UPI0010FAE8E6|nr:uncharacterized protein LOC114934365 isoform X2 [Nylanderia fulva]
MDAYTKQDKKHYAVVKFLSDGTFSEIPTAWLCKEGETDQCWWPPRTANSTILITNCASPNTDIWSRHEIEIIKYCSSLESARKSASDAYYHTTDDERLGRGKRQLRPYNRYDSSDEEHEETQSRKFNKKQRYSCNRSNNSDEEEYEETQSRELNIKGKRLTEKNCSSAIASTLPSCPDNFGLNNNVLSTFNTHNVSQKSCGSRFNETLSKKGMESVSLSKQKEKEAEEVENIPIIFDGYVPCIEDIKENVNIKQNLQQMVHMQATVNITLQDINQRLKRIEKAILTKCVSNFDVNDNIITKFLPCSTVERIKQFESLLKTTEEAVTQFREYLLKIGGNNPKDNIQQILKKIFTNECAMNCSMKGIRNNFRVGDLNIIKIVRRDLTLRHASLTESDFDGIVAEWLRFAKQRKEREDKTKEQDNEENDVQHNVDE